eukprot:15366675-Ditylum_brightwellii.AAC.1
MYAEVAFAACNDDSDLDSDVDDNNSAHYNEGEKTRREMEKRSAQMLYLLLQSKSPLGHGKLNLTTCFSSSLTVMIHQGK